MYFTVQPLLSDKIDIPEAGGDPKELSNKRRLVNIFKQIRETEFEHDMGIISDEDFVRTNNELKLEASKFLDNSEGEHEDEDEVDESGIIEIDGVKYAPIVAEEDDDEDKDEVDEQSTSSGIGKGTGVS
jgi:hypothetical protein